MIRSALVSVLIFLMAILIGPVHAQDEARPPVGGVMSPQGAMIFYVAHGPDDACGPGCSEWIAAEGAVQWDTFKRLFAFLDRIQRRKLPVVLNIWGQGDLNVATTMGKIFRERGLDVSVGATVPAECAGATEAACFALKRGDKSLEAKIDNSFVVCDVVCVLALAGGVQRSLPARAKVVIGPTHIYNRGAPNVSDEQQQGLQSLFGDRYRIYLTQMGVHAELVDIIDQNAKTGRTTQLSPDDCLRLGLVTPAAH